MGAPPRDPLMHAPSYTYGHCLPAAGQQPRPQHVFRYNRVVPFYPPDPCIRPNETDLMCPGDVTPMTRNDLLPTAGTPSYHGDIFRLYSVRKPKAETICTTDVHAGSMPCSALGEIQNMQECPCINRSHPTKAGLRNVNVKAHKMDHGGALYRDQRAVQCRCQSQSCENLNFGANFEVRGGARGPTPCAMSGHHQNRHQFFAAPAYSCQNPYFPSPYICRPVFDRKYLLDCPEQDGPPADSYTFL